MNRRLFLLRLLLLVPVLSIALEGYSQTISLTNDYAAGAKRGYYNWRIYLQGSNAALASIESVEYTLHPTFKNPVQVVQASPSNPNFMYAASGWGEFDIKVKIVFRNARQRPLYLVYPLDLHSPAKKTALRNRTNVYLQGTTMAGWARYKQSKTAIASS